MRHVLLFSFGLMTLLTVTATRAVAGPTPAQKCAASKQKCAADAFGGQMKCYRKSALTGLPLDAACTQKVLDKGLACFAKADAKGGCNPGHEDPQHILVDDINALVEDLAINDLMP